MAEPQLTKILISILFIGLVAVGFAQFYAKGSLDYELTTYDNSSLQVYISSTASIENITNTTDSKLKEAGAKDDGLFDIIGAFFSGAWTSLKTTGDSIGVLQNIASDGVSKIPFMNSSFAKALKMYFVTSIIILIIIGIFIHFFKPGSRL